MSDMSCISNPETMLQEDKRRHEKCIRNSAVPSERHDPTDDSFVHGRVSLTRLRKTKKVLAIMKWYLQPLLCQMQGRWALGLHVLEKKP